MIVILGNQARVPNTRRLIPSVSIDLETVAISTTREVQAAAPQQIVRPRSDLLRTRTAVKVSDGKGGSCEACR